MDTRQSITYRDFLLNDPDISDNITGGGYTGTGIDGCAVDSVSYADVDVIQWTEKRSQGDGNDAGDVFLGARRIRMSGTLYGLTRALLADNLSTLRAALNPVLAQREEPADKGYRPLYFSVPTNRLADYSTGLIDLQMFAMPRSIDHTDLRDAQGGDPGDALALPWQAVFICRDPGIYGRSPVEVDFTPLPTPVTDATATAATNLINKASHGLVAGDRITIYEGTGGNGPSGGVTYYVISSGLTGSAFKISLTSGGTEVDITADYSNLKYVKSVTFADTWLNRGTYLGKFNMLVEVGKGAGTIAATVGDSIFTITVPASTGNRIIRLKEDKVLTFEENDIETDQMSAITWTNDTTWPLIDPGITPYSVTFHGMAGVTDGSRMWFYESYA